MTVVPPGGGNDSKMRCGETIQLPDEEDQFPEIDRDCS
jgi:hypothetical protein